MRLRIVHRALDTYRGRVDTQATREQAEQAITAAVLRALATGKLEATSTQARRGEDAEIQRLRCPPDERGLRLRFAFIRRGDELHMIETIRPHAGWDASPLCACGHPRRMHGPRVSGGEQSAVHVGGTGRCHAHGCECAAFSAMGPQRDGI